MTYLIVGMDQQTLAPWRQNVRASDVTSAMRFARARARSLGVELVVAAVIGPGSSVIS